MKNKTLNRCLDIIKSHKKTIIIISLFAIIIDIIEISKPYLIKTIIDDFLTLEISEKGFLTVTKIGIMYLALVVMGNVLDFTTRMKTNIMGEEILYTLRNRIYKYTQDASIKFHDKTPAGTLFVRITNDVEDISVLFKEVISTIFKDVISIIVIVLVMLYFSVKLSLLSFIILPFVIITSIILTIILNKI